MFLSVHSLLRPSSDQIIKRVSTDASGQEAINGYTQNARISADGRYVVFQSTASNLVAGDTNGNWDVFRKDMLTGAIIRVSTGALGQQGDDHSENPDVSPDGRYVVFESGANLVSEDTGITWDIFRKIC